MQKQIQDEIHIKRKKRKRNGNAVQYLLFFALMFSLALYGVTYIVDSYSPDVDVQIGNSEPITLTDEDMSINEKTVDERLKWIQEEDELPSVIENEPHLYSQEEVDKTSEEGKSKQVIEPPKKQNYDEQKKEDISVVAQTPETKTKEKEKSDYLAMDLKRAAQNSGVIPKPTPLVSKVVVGKFSSLDEALNIQNKLNGENLNVSPFIKAVKNYYVVQVGSFSDKERADSLSSELKAKGYSSSVIYEN